jgi:hypothetical protein
VTGAAAASELQPHRSKDAAEDTRTICPLPSCRNRKVGDVAERLTRSRRNYCTPALGDPRANHGGKIYALVACNATHITRNDFHDIKRHTSQVTRHTSHLTRHTSLVTRHTSHLTPHTSHVTRHTSHLTPHTSHVTPHTSHVTRRTSHVTRHTSHVTHHTSHVTRHTSHVTRHASHVTRHTSLTAASCAQRHHQRPAAPGPANRRRRP